MADLFYGGPASGQVVATSGISPVINGLTVPPYITIKNATVSKSIAYIGDSLVTTATGYPLEPGDAVIVETGMDRTRWYVTTDGLTARVSYITAAGRVDK